MSLIFVFIDGVGIGGNIKDNPFIQEDYPSFFFMTGNQLFTLETEFVFEPNHCFTALDANLGVKGLPQSGTGQVALFSGINASRLLGRHFGPFPHTRIRHLLDHHGLFQRFKRAGGRCFFVNAFPKVYFDKVEKKNRWSTTTLMTKKAGIKLNGVSEVIKEEAITAELTQELWRSRLALPVPVITEKTAALRVLEAAKKNDLVLVEYYLTDVAGHSQSRDMAGKILKKLDLFLSALIRDEARPDHMIVVTSDHGNLEDLSTRKHTRNKIPLFAIGPGADLFHEARSLLDVAPLCQRWFQSAPGVSERE